MNFDLNPNITRRVRDKEDKHKEEPNPEDFDASILRLPNSIKPNKPETFDGGLETSVETWLFSLENFNVFYEMNDSTLIYYATSLLVGNAMNWWRLRRIAEEEGTLGIIEAWHIFKEELIAQFKPINAEKTARDKLAVLKQSTSVRDYANSFRKIMLDIPNYGESNKLDTFTRGLKYELRKEVETREPATFEKAAGIAERLDSITQQRNRNEYEPKQQSQFRQSQFRPQYTQRIVRATNPMEIDTIQTSKLSEMDKQLLKKKGCCFYCRKPGHIALDCPAKRRNNVTPLNSQNQ